MIATSRLAVLACLTCAANCGVVLGQSYDMALTDASGIDGSLMIGIDTTGSLIGDWDPDTNPTGTRTKPGIFGSFGATENLPVPSTVGLAIGDDLVAGSSGGFTLLLDAAGSQATVSGSVLDLLGGDSLALPADITLSFDSFRTRAPDSTFIGGFPITLPLGELSLTALLFTQTEPAAGLLTPIGPGAWTVAFAIQGELTGEVDALGSPLELPPTPAVLPLAGTLTLAGGELVFSAAARLEQDSTQEPMTTLPPIPLPLPTILPAGSTANLVANLTLDELSVGFAADIMVEARGEAVTCRADCDGDGTLTVFDFLCFFSLFDSGDLAADCDGDGTLTLFDFLCFQSEFDTGCP